MKIASCLVLLFALSISCPTAHADSFSVSGDFFTGNDSMGFSVFAPSSTWLSSAPTGPTIIAFSTVGQMTTLEIGARAWPGPGFADASGPWGSTSNVDGGIVASGKFIFRSTIAGAVTIKVPVIVSADLVALTEDTGDFLGSLDFSRKHGIATLQGFSDGKNVEWDFGSVRFPITVVPEPTTFVLVAAGLAGIVSARKRMSR